MTCDAIRAAAARVPEERERDVRRAAELDRQIANLVNALADGALTSAAVGERLRAAEAEKSEIEGRLSQHAGLVPVVSALPDEAWVARRLGDWAVRTASDDGSTSLLRLALQSVAAEAVLAPGKSRGYTRLLFRIDAWSVLVAAVGDALPTALHGLIPSHTGSHEFVTIADCHSSGPRPSRPRVVGNPKAFGIVRQAIARGRDGRGPTRRLARGLMVRNPGDSVSDGRNRQPGVHNRSRRAYGHGPVGTANRSVESGVRDVGRDRASHGP